MRAASIIFIFLISELNLTAQPELQPTTKLQITDTLISQVYSIDSLENVMSGSKLKEHIPFLRIGKTLDGIPAIVSCSKYLYISSTDSIPVEQAEAAFNENGNMIYSSRYSRDNEGQNWNLLEKVEYYYDLSGRDTSRIIYQHSAQENKMVLVYKWSTRYNELGDKVFNKQYSNLIGSDSWIETTWEYKYNYQGSLLTANHYFIDSSMPERVSITKLEQEYDEMNNKVSREMYSHDKDMNWIGQEKLEWEYDSEGRKRNEIVYKWDVTGSQWLLSRKSEYSLDSLNNISDETVFIHDNNLNTWLLNRKIYFIYDFSGNIVLKTCFEFDPLLEKWIGAYRFDYIYDTEGREIESIQFDWDNVKGEWIPLWNKQMNYGSIVFLASYTWSYDLSDWIGDWKRETRYNTYGDYYLDAYYEWDSIYSDWNVMSGIRWDRYYDVNNHEIESLGYNWKHEVLDWVPGGKFEWIYNGEGELILSIDHMWIQDKQDWALYSKTFYNYRKGFVTGIKGGEKHKITIFPNPAGSFLRIDGIESPVSIEIYSTTGNLMLRERTWQSQLDISILPNGIYIIVLQLDNKPPFTDKILKQ